MDPALLATIQSLANLNGLKSTDDISITRIREWKSHEIINGHSVASSLFSAKDPKSAALDYFKRNPCKVVVCLSEWLSGVPINKTLHIYKMTVNGVKRGVKSDLDILT